MTYWKIKGPYRKSFFIDSGSWGSHQLVKEDVGLGTIRPKRYYIYMYILFCFVVRYCGQISVWFNIGWDCLSHTVFQRRPTVLLYSSITAGKCLPLGLCKEAAFKQSPIHRAQFHHIIIVSCWMYKGNWNWILVVCRWFRRPLELPHTAGHPWLPHQLIWLGQGRPTGFKSVAKVIGRHRLESEYTVKSLI